MKTSTPWYKALYAQVILAVLIGALFGYLYPGLGAKMQPLGDGFIRLIKMIIAPIIFCTVVNGIASAGDIRKLGRIGTKTLLYFEVVSTLALVIGLVVVNLLEPGKGFDIDVTELDPSIAQSYVAKGEKHTLTQFILDIIPRSFFDAFATGNILQILLVSTLSGFAISALGEKGVPILKAVHYAESVFFGIMKMIVKVAPLAAFGAISYTVGAHGIRSFEYLFYLMAGFYITSGLFVLVVLGAIARFAGFSIVRFLIYIKEELLFVLGTSSSETALPGMIAKMRRLGCADSTVGFVIPTGYSFNLDGTNIYMTMAAVFLAQATNTPLSLGEQISLLVVAMISSKGATGVTGAGFVTLAATLAVVPAIPIESIAILIGIDRFMSECRALTNLIGNGVATVVISRWENEVSAADLRKALRQKGDFTQPLPAVEEVEVQD